MHRVSLTALRFSPDKIDCFIPGILKPSIKSTRIAFVVSWYPLQDDYTSGTFELYHPYAARQAEGLSISRYIIQLLSFFVLGR